MEGAYLPITRCPVYRGRDSNPGFRMELETLVGDGKRKGASGNNREAESSDVSDRGGLPRNSNEAG